MSMFIVGAKRTPFGAFGKSLKSLTATDLGVVSTKAALGSIDPTTVDSCYFGNVIQSNSDAAYLARHVALKSGARVDSTALTINRLCGSGFETLLQSMRDIQLGSTNISIAGGTEQMSQAPLSVRGDHARFGTRLGSDLAMTDMLWAGLTDAHAGLPMGKTAENLATKYNISRQDCDEYAVQSQNKYQQALAAGLFADELAPVPLKKGALQVDEHPRAGTTVEKIGSLPPVFGGVVSAANASGICDGAGTCIVASEAAVKTHNLTPLARLVDVTVTGCDPTIMGIGPVAAIQQLLQRNQLKPSDIDITEVNEAFAAQVLAVAKELDMEVNPHGGAIAVGHPLAASGSRITAHLCHQFAHNTNHTYYIGAACIGGGQGIAVLLERA